MKNERDVKTESEMIDYLRRLCQAKSQKEIAQDFGCSDSYISSLLSGKSVISQGLASKMGYRMYTNIVRTFELITEDK